MHVQGQRSACSVIGDIAAFFLNQIGAIAKLAKGQKYTDSVEHQDIVDAALQVQISWYEREIAKIHYRLYTIKTNQSCEKGFKQKSRNLKFFTSYSFT